MEVISAAQQSFDLYNEDLGASGPCGPGLDYCVGVSAVLW